MTRVLLLALASAPLLAALWLLREQTKLTIAAQVELRECQLISSELMMTQARLLGWEYDPDMVYLRRTPGVWPSH